MAPLPSADEQVFKIPELPLGLGIKRWIELPMCHQPEGASKRESLQTSTAEWRLKGPDVRVPQAIGSVSMRQQGYGHFCGGQEPRKASTW